MSDEHLVIKLRRSKLDINKTADQSKLNTPQLEFGEGMYLDTNKYLIIGDGDETTAVENSDLYRFKAFKKAIVDNQVFNNTTDVLTKENGTVINPKTTATNVSITYDSKASNVNAVISTLNTNIGTNTTNIKSNTTNIGTNATNIASIKTSLATDEKNIATNTTNIATNTGNISSLQTKVNATQKNSTLLYVAGVPSASGQFYYNSAITITTGNVLKGAAWNDFAEYRKCNAPAGCVVVEKGDGSLTRCNGRLLPGAAVVSDTYGMIIGKDDEGYAPIAVAGRVLAYSYDREKLKAGDPVCTGLNGTVSKMSRLETILYPDRIIGYVSEIPSYALWNNVLVNNRIWIKVK